MKTIPLSIITALSVAPPMIETSAPSVPKVTVAIFERPTVYRAPLDEEEFAGKNQHPSWDIFDAQAGIEEFLCMICDGQVSINDI